MKPHWIFILSFLLVAGGFLLPLWPLAVGGVLLAAVSGRWLVALVLGVMLDAAWGVPGGFLHVVGFPFTALAVAVSAARPILGRYIFEKSPDIR